ncbi:secretion protein [Methanothermobacter tenebrarum]|jgi:flagellar protein FlaI|uniref:Secretion protein n=1 Tax=Methanothermobacter tenebrarum TaxID=680118 RepID=A0ABN6PFS5_9EURY|nr:CpaF family protein [Methanothermobacter tenebrarum]MDX9692791.1 CpaF family protein [Methanothermobacter sp.]BDH80065.1 secretion protein [Methanothermobacter tenebrarum]
MKDKRKEILREILGEFADDSFEAENGNVKSEKESTLDIDKIIQRKLSKPKRADVKEVEIIEEELIPLYKVSLPEFSEKERELINEIRAKVVEAAVTAGGEFQIDKKTLMKEIKDFLRVKGIRNIDRLAKQIVQEMLGYGEIDPLIRDDNLEEIMIIGVKKPVFVYHRDKGMMITNLIFDDAEDIKALIDLIARQVGRRIDQQTPILDARLPDGSRVNATIPSVSPDGPTLTVRKFRKDPYTIIDLINFKTLSSYLAAFLWVCTDGLGVKPCNAIIAGGTSSGKTTTLNTIAAFIPPRERVITIEDTLELQLPHPHILRLETRPPNIEGKGEIDMDTLVKNSLRQRPDRIIVGEVRGPEAITLFTALNTGHSGFGTLHSNTAQETITRLANRPMNVPSIMIPALDFIIMQNRMYSSSGRSIRRITEVAEVVGMEEDRVQLNRIFEWDNVTDKVEYVGIASQTLREIAELRGMSITEIEEEIERRRLVLEYMAEENIRSIDEVAKYIHGYYKDPEKILEKVL